jgi:hypothetical protein
MVRELKKSESEGNCHEDGDEKKYCKFDKGELRTVGQRCAQGFGGEA